ncbi:hypothetical protein OC842_006785 [Tilletia horrida]|uniref:Uncharacterized protein n=1 Tax=Tilletia horrida TaxID=155126 RepID=A0AAN6JHL9_9BASI|nr:hypothetical protein OC842_006785 [Tilletia horrida]KAK0557124.1 hypothetical protein OC844_005674 [Tilletia horrida]
MASVLPSLQPGATGPAPLLPADSGQSSSHLLEPELQTTTHLISIAPASARPAASGASSIFSPQNTHFVVNIIHLRDSLAVWVGSAPRDLVDRAARRQTTQATHAAEDDDEERLDRELADALRQAGRLEDNHDVLSTDRSAASEALPPPRGALAVEWAVAMSRPGQTAPLGSSLFRTNADVALPMSHRLATKLALSQLFLSLDLPSSLVSPATAMMPAPPERSRKLLLLERGIADAIRAGMKTVEERRRRKA